MKSKIRKIEDAFTATNRNPVLLPDVSMLPEKDRQYIVDNYKLTVVVEALNQESNGGNPWEPNYNDSSEEKWEPYFWIDANEENPAGFGFSSTSYGRWITRTNVGSRLCYRTREVAQYAVETFPELYKSVIIKQK